MAKIVSKPRKKLIKTAVQTQESGEFILDSLFQVIESRKNADPDVSYVASLFKKGLPKIAQKVGEEAVETAIAAVQKPVNKTKIAQESADLLFHLLVLWSKSGVSPQDTWKILKKRENIGGLVEKSSRKMKK